MLNTYISGFHMAKNFLFACLTLNLLIAPIALVQAQDRSSVKVGVILPFTGPLAEYGVAMRNGITLAKKANPDIFEKIEFIFEDSQYSPQSAITIFRKFVSDGDVEFVMNFGCPTSQALVPIVEQAKIPTAMFCSALLMTKDRRYSFGMTAPANEWSSILWDYLQSSDFKKICLVLTDNDYLLSEYNALAQVMKASGSPYAIEVLDTYAPQDTDFRSSALKIKSKSCDALGVYMLPGQVRTFFNQTRGLKLDVQIFGTDIFESKEEILASKKGMEGAVFVNLSLPGNFKERYVKSYGNDNQVTSACVIHDMVTRIAPLLDSNQTGKELMTKIAQLSEEEVMCGSSRYVRSDTGEQFIRFPLTLKKVMNDEIVQVG